MLKSYIDSCRARRCSLAAGMALALAGRSAGLVPALRVPASTNSARQNASLRSSRSSCLRSGILVKDIAIVNTPGCMTVRPLSKGLDWANVPLSSMGCRVITVARPATGRQRRMCSNSNVAENRSGSVVGDSSSIEGELSAGDLALSAQIKAKGDMIRDLKAGGATKNELRPHIEVSEFECSSDVHLVSLTLNRT